MGITRGPSFYTKRLDTQLIKPCIVSKGLVYELTFPPFLRNER